MMIHRLIRFFYFVLIALSFGIPISAQKVNNVRYVNPLMGTLSTFELSSGNTYPAIARPWGMNFWVPQTRNMGDGWQYVYTDHKIKGFKQTHQPSPWMNDYGQFSIMPITGKPVFDQESRASWFSHKSEIAKPYYYSVYLADHDVTTEVTTTSRAAFFQFTFPESSDSYIVVDAFDQGSFVKVIPNENKIIGFTTRNSGGVPKNFKNYFIIIFDKPFEYKSIVRNSQILEGKLHAMDKHVGAIIGFNTASGEVVHARIASSFISPEQAELNLRELDNKTFDDTVNEGKKRWNSVLGSIEVNDDNDANLETFYSCFYRSILFPRSFYEINAHNKVVHYSPFTGEILPGYMFTDTGFWDTFRSLFPFLNLVYPSINEKIQAGLVNAYKESGFLPEWSSPGHRNIMVGNNSASIVADAYLKGLKGYDINTLWEAVKHGANSVHPTVQASGRAGFVYYNQYGYIPRDVGVSQSVARTLEYAYDDWTIFKLGQMLNRPYKEISIYKDRAMNYKNIFDYKYKLMRGRNADGTFPLQFDPVDWSSDFTEGNSWHYSWSVFHDPQGLIDLMGGTAPFNAMLDSVFNVSGALGMDSRKMIHEMREMEVMNMGQYAHGNQPIQHMIYLYNYGKEPWKAQYWVREVLDKLYSATPDGYCGDEDNGQTSSWYLFSAMGFYPVCPGSNQYVLGSPLFKSVKLNFENGKSLLIKAKNNSQENRYISKMSFNGKVYDKNYLMHDDLMKGGIIDFIMTSKPNVKRGISPSSVPYSFTNELNN